jgi:hypothetical protein
MRSRDDYILRAEGFEKLAQEKVLTEHRDFYLALAKEYRDLADAADRLRSQSEPVARGSGASQGESGSSEQV